MENIHLDFEMINEMKSRNNFDKNSSIQIANFSTYGIPKFKENKQKN